MSEEDISKDPKKHFFKLPGDVSAMKDDEIDALAEKIWSKFMINQEVPKNE